MSRLPQQGNRGLGGTSSGEVTLEANLCRAKLSHVAPSVVAELTTR